MKAVEHARDTIYLDPPAQLEKGSLHYCLVQVGKRGWAVAEYSGKVNKGDRDTEVAGLEFVVVTDSMLRVNAVEKLKEFRSRRLVSAFESSRMSAANEISDELEFPAGWSFARQEGWKVDGDLYTREMTFYRNDPVAYEKHRLSVIFAPGEVAASRFYEENVSSDFLPSLRRDAAESALSSYDFGEESVFIDNGRWDGDDANDEWTCLMRMESSSGEEYRQGFIVRFKPGTAEVTEAYPGDIH